jgi:hypothetical protein
VGLKKVVIYKFTYQDLSSAGHKASYNTQRGSCIKFYCGNDLREERQLKALACGEE